MLRNKSYNFIQSNYMFISKLHKTQFKFNGSVNYSHENPFFQRDGETVTNQTIFRTGPQQYSDKLVQVRDDGENQTLFKLALAKETEKSKPALTVKQLAFVNRTRRFEGEITSLPTPQSKAKFETNYGKGVDQDFDICSGKAILNLIIMMPIENAEIISDFAYNNAPSDKIDSLPPVYKRLAQRIKEMSKLEFMYGTIPDYIAQYKEANEIN
jgi:hypothetical protein